MFSWFGKINFTPHTKVDGFAEHLKNGYLMGSRCTSCGFATFPPRADCPTCLGSDFEYREWSGRGELLTFTRISAAPTGFEDDAPYVIGVIDLEEGGRLVGWFGETLPEPEIAIGMKVQVVPRIFEELEQIKLTYTLERPGARWGKAPLPS